MAVEACTAFCFLAGTVRAYRKLDLATACRRLPHGYGGALNLPLDPVQTFDRLLGGEN